MAVLLLLHTPDGVESARGVVNPLQTVIVPVMGATTGSGLTVISTAGEIETGQLLDETVLRYHVDTEPVPGL